jgi:plasmid replication initiation protein
MEDSESKKSEKPEKEDHDPVVVNPPTRLVKVSNVFLRKDWNFESIWQARLLYLAAAKIKRSDTKFVTFVIPAEELNPGYHYGAEILKQIKKDIRHVMGFTVVRTYEKDHFDVRHVFEKMTFDKGDVTVKIHSDMCPYFLQLHSFFAELEFCKFVKLSTVYSQKLFLFLKTIDWKSEEIISVEELQNILDTPEKMKKHFSDWKRRILDPAIQQIIEKMGVYFECEPIKVGRKHRNLKFIFDSQKALEYRDQELLKIKRSQDLAQHKINKAAELCARICHKSSGGVCYNFTSSEKCKICVKYFVAPYIIARRNKAERKK